MIERENRRNFLVNKYQDKRKQIQNNLKKANYQALILIDGNLKIF